jgi:hypothetical protein
MDRLSDEAIARIEAMLVEADGLRALSALALLRDPTGELGRWQLAGRVEALLSRFASTAWPRIARGGREPKNPAEEAMTKILAAGLPMSRRRLLDLIG